MRSALLTYTSRDSRRSITAVADSRRMWKPSSMKRKLSENLKRTQDRIASACARANRDPGEVRLVAVTKYAGIEIIRALLDIGVRDFGESRVQELTHRAAMLQESLVRRPLAADGPPPAPPRWHMIGHLQRNKVRPLLPWVEMIHSLDSLRLAEDLDAESARLGRTIPVFLEINASGETSKEGVAVAAATHFVEQLNSLKHLELRGLMAMAPLSDDEAVIRNAFGRMRELFDEIVCERVCGPKFHDLSMGMSNDFEHAIEFGATYVRIGSALFEGIELTSQPASSE